MPKILQNSVTIADDARQPCTYSCPAPIALCI